MHPRVLSSGGVTGLPVHGRISYQLVRRLVDKEQETSAIFAEWSRAYYAIRTWRSRVNNSSAVYMLHTIYLSMIRSTLGRARVIYPGPPGISRHVRTASTYLYSRPRYGALQVA